MKEDNFDTEESENETATDIAAEFVLRMTEDDWLENVDMKDMDIMMNDLKKRIREYAKQKCKEQRRICSVSFDDYDGEHFGISHEVFNAPEPEFEEYNLNLEN